jgi:hypothetical protein
MCSRLAGGLVDLPLILGIVGPDVVQEVGYYRAREGPGMDKENVVFGIEVEYPISIVG